MKLESKEAYYVTYRINQVCEDQRSFDSFREAMKFYGEQIAHLSRYVNEMDECNEEIELSYMYETYDKETHKLLNEGNNVLSKVEY